MNKFTLLLQGKLHPNTIKMCNLHKDMETVISTWGSREEVLEFLGKSHRSNMQIVTATQPILPNHRNESNRAYQFTTTFNGLSVIDTNFAIKARTDEYYTYLAPMIRVSNDEPEKIITNNVFFRKSKFYMYHPSDHLLAGKTDNLLKLFKECKRIVESMDMFPQDLRPEQMIGTVYILQKERMVNENFKLNLHKNEEGIREATILMKKYFNVINSQSLAPFNVVANSFKKDWETLGFTDARYDVISNMSEIYD